MKMFKLALISLALLLVSFKVNAQQSPNVSGTASGHVIVNISQTKKSAIVATKKVRNPRLKERSYPYIDIALPKGTDPAWKPNSRLKSGSNSVMQTILNFNGQTTDNTPSDCIGAIGPNHFLQAVNSTYAIYNKTNGNLIKDGPLSDYFPSTLPGGGGNDGDPIVLYDEFNNRWFLSQFETDPPYYMLIAISKTDDPTGEWDSYSFSMNGNPDYMKFGIWNDGYYMATYTTGASNVYVFEKEAMLTGADAPQYIGFDNIWSPTTIDGFHCLMPADNDITAAPAGTPGTFLTINDDAIGGGTDQLWIYECIPDWTNLANSTFERTQQLDVAAFDSNFGADWTNIMQPNGQEVDGIPQILMQRVQYINFGTHQTIVACHTVDVDGNDRAGIRWYELQKTGSTWTVRQQNTYSPDANSRWMGSISMNANGEIAVGYSISSQSIHPGIKLAGQSSDANASANNTLDVPEKTIHLGEYSQSGSERWGDYSGMSIDPVDQQSFWFTSQYRTASSLATKITGVNFATACIPPTIEASAFSASSINDNDMTIGWTRGDGQSVLVIAKEGGAVEGLPEQGVSYTASQVFETGDAIGNGGYVVYKGTGNSVTISGINSGTEYHFALFEFNSTDNCYMQTALLGNATTTGVPPCIICQSFGETTFNTSITLVDFNTINNPSAKPAGYNDYTSISTDLTQNSSYNLSVNLNTDGDYIVTAKAWIDWNQDCDFDDIGEEYDLGAASNVSDGATSLSPLSITVPADATIGQTRMRITAKYELTANSCETGLDGEVEDYTVNILSSGSNPPIADFTANKTSITEGGSINFTDNSTNSPTSWNWTFDGGTPSSSSLQNPTDIVYNSSGTYNVTLVATNADGSDIELKTGYITVNPALNPPVANFSSTATTIDEGGSISFTDLSTNTPTTWLWSFNGGIPSSSTVQNPTNINYSTAGNYSVTLTATNADGSGTVTKTNYISVVAVGTNPPVANFGVSTTNIIENGSVDFTDLSTNNPTEWLWTFEGGTPASSTLRNPGGITYSTAGIYSVSLTATNADGSDTETKTGLITVASLLTPPISEFSVSATHINMGESINFFDLSSNSPGSWSWTFEGGTPSTSDMQNPTGIMYSTAGVYNVTLVVTNTDGNDTEIKTGYITVNEVIPPTAAFGASISEVKVGQSITFTDLSSETPTSWQWTFEGGTPASSTEQNPTVTYNEPGTYDVQLVSGNAGGNSTELKTDFITVNPLVIPQADFEADFTTIKEGESINFTDLSTNTPTSWLWTFDGATQTSSALQNPTGIEYPAFGEYNVSLEVTNNDGANSVIKNNYIKVDEVWHTPTNFQATANNSDVSLTWTHVEGNRLNYNIYRTEINETTPVIFTTTESSYLDELVPNGTYNYYVTSVYATGESAPSGVQQVEVSGTNTVFPLNKEAYLLVYPNPGNGIYTFKVRTNTIIDLSIIIYSTTGQEIASYGYKNITDGIEKSFDISRKGKGIYIMKVFMNSKVVVKKLMIE